MQKDSWKKGAVAIAVMAVRSWILSARIFLAESYALRCYFSLSLSLASSRARIVNFITRKKFSPGDPGLSAMLFFLRKVY